MVKAFFNILLALCKLYECSHSAEGLSEGCAEGCAEGRNEGLAEGRAGGEAKTRREKAWGGTQNDNWLWIAWLYGFFFVHLQSEMMVRYRNRENDTKMKQLQADMRDLLQQEEESKQELKALFKKLGYNLH